VLTKNIRHTVDRFYPYIWWAELLSSEK